MAWLVILSIVALTGTILMREHIFGQVQLIPNAPMLLGVGRIASVAAMNELKI